MDISLLNAWLYGVISVLYVSLEIAGLVYAPTQPWLEAVGQVYKLYVGLILTVVFFPWRRDSGAHHRISATTRNVAFSAGGILFLSGALRTAVDFVAARVS